ncbi:hypothetical protein U9M48_027376 [Paspalum notatum var. saurae]|uniref:Uncharacterized protein n=1 Tax=Paspalum notatum var. saurae TaxID=547442 RepID=A0AAQ3TZC0_PASNO
MTFGPHQPLPPLSLATGPQPRNISLPLASISSLTLAIPPPSSLYLLLLPPSSTPALPASPALPRWAISSCLSPFIAAAAGYQGRRSAPVEAAGCPSLLFLLQPPVRFPHQRSLFLSCNLVWIGDTKH